MIPTRRFLQVSFLLFVGSATLLLGYYLSGVLNPIIFAFLLAYILNPLTNYLEEKGISRKWAVSLIFVFLLICIGIFLFIIVPIAYTELSELVELIRNLNYQQIADQFGTWLSNKINQWNAKFPSMKLGEENTKKFGRKFIKDNIQSIAVAAKDTGFGLFHIVGGGLSLIGSLLYYIVLLPIFSFFFLLHINRIWDSFLGYIPANREERIVNILGKMHRAISGFFRGQLMVCLIKGVLVGILLSIIGVDYSLLLAFLAFVGSFVPFMITVISLLPALAITLLSHGFDVWMLLQIALVYGFVDLLEGLVLYPYIVGREAGVHPLIILVSFLVGGKLFGFFGVLLSIPLATVLIIFGREVVLSNLKDVMGRSTDNKESVDDTERAPDEPDETEGTDRNNEEQKEANKRDE